VLRHRRLRYASAIGQGVHGLFSVAGEALEDRPAGGVGEGFENVVRYGLHSGIITVWLLIVKTPVPPLWGAHPESSERLLQSGRRPDRGDDEIAFTRAVPGQSLCC